MAHPEVQTFPCPICSRQFSLKGNMKAHLVVHSKERKFKCSYPLCPYTGKRRSDVQRHEHTIHGTTRPFQCPQCPYSAKEKGTLDTHLFNQHSSTVLSGPLIPCPVPGCKYQTRNPRYLKHHEGGHARSSKKVKCPLCDFRCTSLWRLTPHMRTHTKETPFKCSLCPYEGKSKGRLTSHCTNVHPPGCPPGMFKCRRCPFTTNTLTQLYSHNSGPAHQITKWRCKVLGCSFFSVEQKDLAIHLQNIHKLPRVLLTKVGVKAAPFLKSLPEKMKGGTKAGVAPTPFTAWKKVKGIKPFGCIQCPYKSVRKLDVKVHSNTVHSTLRPFKCPKEGCKFAAKTNGDLRKHCLNHLEVKNLKCPQCNYQTNQKNDLKRHYRIHSGEKEFKCSYCPFETNQRQNLAAHVRLHTGETPYKCKECGYQTRINSCFHQHMKGHQGRQRVNCPKCPFSTIWKPSLKLHLKTMHGHGQENK